MSKDGEKLVAQGYKEEKEFFAKDPQQVGERSDIVRKRKGGKVVKKKEGKKIAYEDESIGGRRGAVGKTDLKGTHAQKEKKRRRMSDAGVYGKLP